MKNYKLTAFGFGIMLLVASCRKNDLVAENNIAPVAQTVASAKFNSLSSWSSSQAENTRTYFSKVSDSSITADVAKSGLVLVYKKEGNSVQSLPFQEKDGKTYWYYQVANGSIRINSDNNSGQDLAQQSFAYFIITPEKLASLEAGGKSRFQLLDLSYEQAAALLK